MTTNTSSVTLEKALHWANQHSYFCLLNGNEIDYPFGGFPKVLAIGAKRLFNAERGNTFQRLFEFHKEKPSWLFGYLGYDLKNELEELTSSHQNHTQFNNACFFEPEHILTFNNDQVEVESEKSDWVIKQISEVALNKSIGQYGFLNQSVSKERYLEVVESLRQHIEEGDIYEINYCQEFWGEILQAAPVETYLRLNDISPKPFSTFQKFADQYLLCASPERFLKKNGEKLISQPIKGTKRRGDSIQADEALKVALRNDEKELAENMMIVDLVRNDLAQTSKVGTVDVEEIFGIYTFEQVHQMISTVTSEIHPDRLWIDAIKKAFPMGSMTGAPKIKVMELIEQYENTRRGIFSGAAGYITPSGDFDLNVIIRSLFLDLENMHYSFQVGGAITYDSIPAQEYEECLIKASAILQLIGQKVKPEKEISI
ncbi:anthranilate synthase component I family protein [Roseivirga misakiensis]|uniref:anthranilate synthase component I family protein n=1 Tax=Roseivirga misakiensis TaxID=1563681 RepID=UPI000AF0114B|nr:anthranilate synthase component I family protein [Roseivirga misakiensis]